MLVALLAALLASLIGMGIRALFNVGKPKTTPMPIRTNHQVLYEFPTDRITNSKNIPIYLNKNNQSVGPYPPEQVLSWLNSGQLSPFDSAIRQGEPQWQPLNMFFSVKQNQ